VKQGSVFSLNNKLNLRLYYETGDPTKANLVEGRNQVANKQTRRYNNRGRKQDGGQREELGVGLVVRAFIRTSPVKSPLLFGNKQVSKK